MFQVIRFGGVFANEGEYTQTQTQQISVAGVIQSAKQTAIVHSLQEGERLGNLIVVYSPQEIRTSDAKSQESDIIVKLTSA